MTPAVELAAAIALTSCANVLASGTEIVLAPFALAATPAASYPGSATTTGRSAEVKASTAWCSGALEPANARMYSFLTPSIAAKVSTNVSVSPYMYRPPLNTIAVAASIASGHGPIGFSLASIVTASAGIPPGVADSCANSVSAENGRTDPPAKIAATRPNVLREMSML